MWLIAASVRKRIRAIIFFIFCLNAYANGQIVYSVFSKEEADLVVFMVDIEEKCDLKVFFIDDESKLGKPGLWKPTDFPDNAQFKVFFTFEEHEAQLKIYIVEIEDHAGWKTSDKQKLLEKK